MTINTRNPVFLGTFSLNIYIIAMIGGLTIGDGNILVPMDTPKVFFANYEYFSPISCLYIQYSDNVVDCFGQTSTCLSLPSDMPPNMPSCSSSVQPYSYNNSRVTFTRSFNTSRAWINAYGWNLVTWITTQAYFTFPLSSEDCGLPIIEFDISTPIFRSARHVQRSQAFSISARTTLTCGSSLNNDKQWKILSCDAVTERCVETNALNQFTAGLSSATRAEISVAAQALPIGIYLFNYTVTMTSTSDFVAFAHTYIRIVASDIRVNLLPSGISVINNGISQTILFQPGAYSSDPDSRVFNPTVSIQLILTSVPRVTVFYLL